MKNVHIVSSTCSNILWIHVEPEPDVFFVKVILNATTIPRGVKRTPQETTGGMVWSMDWWWLIYLGDF